MRSFPLIFVLLVAAACAPMTPEGIYRTNVELTVPSTKSPRMFAMCVTGVLPDAAQLLNDGEHYWIVRNNAGLAYERWDFLPTATGSIAQRRSGQLASTGSSKVRDCV